MRLDLECEFTKKLNCFRLGSASKKFITCVSVGSDNHIKSSNLTRSKNCLYVAQRAKQGSSKR